MLNLILMLNELMIDQMHWGVTTSAPIGVRDQVGKIGASSIAGSVAGNAKVAFRMVRTLTRLSALATVISRTPKAETNALD